MSNEELVKLYQEGNKKALNELIEQNIGIIKKMANKYNGMNKMLEFDELFNSGVIGFIYAVQKYDFNNEKKAKFITYAVHYINKYIYSCVHGRTSKDVENNKFYNSCVSINTPLSNDDNFDIQDTIESQEEGFKNIEEKLYLKQLRNDLEEAMIKNNTLEEREMIKLDYGWECSRYSQVEIANIFNISYENVKYILTRALKKLRLSVWGRTVGEKYRSEIISYHIDSYRTVERKIDDEIEKIYKKLAI